MGTGIDPCSYPRVVTTTSGNTHSISWGEPIYGHPVTVSSVPDQILPKIKRVIFNDPVTVVLWEDGTKTVVRTQGKDFYWPTMGLAMCIAKRACGNKSRYNKMFSEWIGEDNFAKIILMAYKRGCVDGKLGDGL